MKEGKRRKAGGGTWSKELIHKIVQQKNKPHKLHVKGTKNLQFSLVTERLTQAVQSPKFGEYDYVSDSDEESESLRLTSRGKLGHAWPMQVYIFKGIQREVHLLKGQRKRLG